VYICDAHAHNHVSSAILQLAWYESAAGLFESLANLIPNRKANETDRAVNAIADSAASSLDSSRAIRQEMHQATKETASQVPDAQANRATILDGSLTGKVEYLYEKSIGDSAGTEANVPCKHDE
jgi:hypothetical protein